MSIKIFYHSLDGSTKKIAEEMAKSAGCECTELSPITPYATSGAQKMLGGGKSVLFKETPKLTEYNNDLDADIIVIGTPVWAGNITPPIRTFLTNEKLEGKKVALFTLSGGGSGGKTEKTIKTLQPNCEVIGTLNLKQLSEENSKAQVEKGVEWVRGLK